MVLGIDVGSSRTSLVEYRGSTTVSLPSYVAYCAEKTGVRHSIYIGEPAKLMFGRTPPSIQVVRPLRAGAIASFGAATHLIEHVLSLSTQSTLLARRRPVFASVPEASTNVERRAIKQCLISAGAKNVSLVRKPIAAAIGSGISISSPTGTLIVDIGGGTCEISITSLTDLIASHTLRMGGEMMDQEIAAHIRREYGILIGDAVSEELKISASTAMDTNGDGDAAAKGRHCITGMPTSVYVSNAEILSTVIPVIDAIANAIRAVLAKAPPDIMADILQNGVLLTGGVSRLYGIGALLEARLRIPFTVINDPEGAVARGLSMIIRDIGKYPHIFVDTD